MLIFKPFLGAAIAAAAIATPASAYDVQFKGRTRATPTLVRDLLTTITQHTKATRKCAFIFSVEAMTMPPNYVPQSAAYRISVLGRVYERWIVNACGQKLGYFVGFWPSPRGGSDFKVSPLAGGRMP
ncbi:hypothetical protein ABC347_04565 [Sphingomonas sp. 1P06PA]|uniref:hypothetical protein n=1 Tax=Sphingomonas sp. 1P06PA TaxID=554121 RepID=UPI0039A49245